MERRIGVVPGIGKKNRMVRGAWGNISASSLRERVCKGCRTKKQAGKMGVDFLYHTGRFAGGGREGRRGVTSQNHWKKRKRVRRNHP